MSSLLKENEENLSSLMQNKGKFPTLSTPSSSKRYTPYSKTPRTDRISRIPTKNPPLSKERLILKDTTNLIAPVNKDLPKETPFTFLGKRRQLSEINKDILSVVGKTWRVYSCSPLYNFDYKKSSLQKYQELLSAHLESNTAKGIAFEIGQDSVNSKFKAEFETLEHFAFYDTDCTGVKVTVHLKKNTVGSKAPILDAIFCYFGDEFEQYQELNCFTCLPLCLSKGPVALVDRIFSWFEVEFDCRIMSMHFSPVELSWYVSLWAGIVPEGSKSDLELCYSVPSSTTGLNRVIYSINADDAKKLWNYHHKNNSAIFTGEESLSFMKALESHFYAHFRVKLDALTLTRIGNPLVFIGCKGQLKIFHAMYVRHILQQITLSVLRKGELGRL